MSKPQVVTKSEIEHYRSDIKNNGVAGVIRTYDALLEKGYDYAGWAKGVAEAKGIRAVPTNGHQGAGGGIGAGLYPPEGSITGRAAVLFLKESSEKNLSEEQLNKIRVGMAQGYLTFLETNIKNNVVKDVDFKSMRDFHKDVFIKNGLDINNWTLETPMKLIGKYEGEEVQEKMWETIRKTRGVWADAWFHSGGLYDIVKDYSDGSRSRSDFNTLLITGNFGVGNIHARSPEIPINRQDMLEAQQWLKDVSLFSSVYKSEKQLENQQNVQMASSNGLDLLSQTNNLIAQLQAGDKQAISNFLATPEAQMAQQTSALQAQELLKQNPALGTDMLPNHFARPTLEEMPQQVQKLYAESKEHLRAYYQDNHIRYDEKTLDNTALALAAEGYRNQMNGVSLLSVDGGKIFIADKSAPVMQYASVDSREAGLTMQNESMEKIQKTEQVFAEQQQQREIEKLAQNNSRGISMS